jgi:hypothetical protein
MGRLDRDAVMFEALTSLKRAGADVIITYFAKRAATLLSEKHREISVKLPLKAVGSPLEVSRRELQTR